MLKVVQTDQEGQHSATDVRSGSLLVEIAREGARRMLAAALKAESDAYVDALVDQVDEDGHRLVVRNGHHDPRSVLTAAGAVEVRAPRVNDKRIDQASGERKRFLSAILPAWCGRSPKISDVLPLLYLHGLSGSDFVPALDQFLGSSAGLSASTITRLTEQWQDEQRAFARHDLSQVDYVYCWADGIQANIGLEEHKLCLLVLIGVRADGSKELITLADGYRESVESWSDLLRDAKRRGMRAPVLAVGDGALGFWGGLRAVFPDTREQRRWFHKSANVLAALPKSAHPAAKKALAEIWGAEDKSHALVVEGEQLVEVVGDFRDGLGELRAEQLGEDLHRGDLRHRPAPHKDHSRARHLVALVRAGVTFVNGKLVERSDDQQTAAPTTTAA
jgi:transposase-like protein